MVWLLAATFWSVAATALIGTFTAVVDWATVPRWTDTPQEYSTTYHWTPIVLIGLSLVLRSNSMVVAEAIRPPRTYPTGRFELCLVWKIRKALAGSTAEIEMTWVPFVVVLAVPACTVGA